MFTIIGLGSYIIASLATIIGLWFEQIEIYLPLSLIFLVIGALCTGDRQDKPRPKR